MPFLIVLIVLMAASVVYVYRFRGDARYNGLIEYFRKGWPIFSPFNCVLYMTTLPRGSKAVLDPAEFPELDLLRENWQAIRDEGLALVRQSYFDAARRPGTASYYDVLVNGEVNANAAWYYPEPKDAAKEIKDHVAFWHGVEVV